MCRDYFRAFVSLAVVVALAACNSGTTNSVAPAAPAANISGDYSGTMQDAQHGSGTATATLAQHNATAGGTITAVEPGGTVTAQVSLTIASTNATSGTMVIDYAGGTTCTFSTTGAYDPNSGALSGSYTAVTNCSGDSGTYSLTQQCTDTVTTQMRALNGVISPC